MFAINESVHLADDELEWSFVRSSGPGGQNVNKVASKAVMRWHLGENMSLPPDAKARLCARQRSRVTTEGDLLITSQRYRDQERNREDCLEKLRAMVLEALAVPKVRKKVKPTRGSKERRLAAKKHRSGTKATRRRPVMD